MDVTLTWEQSQWQDAAARLATSYALTNPSEVPVDEDGAGWRNVLELGIPALRCPSISGVDAASVESALAVEQAARQLSPLPVLGQGVVAPELLDAAGAGDLLDSVVSGDLRIAPALTSDLRDFGRAGEPAVAFDAAGASHALLIDGTQLVAVPIGNESISGLDLSRQLFAIAPDSARADLPTGQPIDPERFAVAHAVALTAFAADLLGVMDAAVTDAVAYAQDRKQFGVPIGTFQAVQHLLADAAVAVEGARGCVWHAAWSVDHLEPAESLLAARTAKAYCSAAGRRVVEATVQVFGGMAITWEHLSHVRLRRVHLDRECFGAEDAQYRAIAGSRLEGVR